MIFSSSSSHVVKFEGVGKRNGVEFAFTSLICFCKTHFFLLIKSEREKQHCFVLILVVSSHLTLFELSDERDAFSVNFLIKSVDEKASLCLRVERWSYLFC